MTQGNIITVWGPFDGGKIQFAKNSGARELNAFPGDDFDAAVEQLTRAVAACPSLCDDWDLRGADERDNIWQDLRIAGHWVLEELTAGDDRLEILDLLRDAFLVLSRTGRHIAWEFLYLGSLEGPVDVGEFLGARAAVGRPYEGSGRRANQADRIGQHSPWSDRAGPGDAFGLAQDARLDSAAGPEAKIFKDLGVTVRELGALKGPSAFDDLKQFVETSNVLTHFNSHAGEVKDARGRISSALYVTDRFPIGLTDIAALPMCRDSIVFLNCCSGAPLAFGRKKHLAGEFSNRRVGAVVATTGPVHDGFATAWAAAFYEHLMAGETVPESILQARQQMLALDANPMSLFYAYLGDYQTKLAQATVAA